LPAKIPKTVPKRNSNFAWLRLFLAASVAYFHAGYFSSLANGGGAPLRAHG